MIPGSDRPGLRRLYAPPDRGAPAAWGGRSGAGQAGRERVLWGEDEWRSGGEPDGSLMYRWRLAAATELFRSDPLPSFMGTGSGRVVQLIPV